MVLRSYPGQEVKANDLLTFPTLFMGIGNLLAVPLAITVGRRPVFLASIIVILVAGIWCAVSKTLDSHIAARAVLALGAGPSEALAPLMVQEIFFLHEKGRKLGAFIFIENVLCGIFFCVSPYIVVAAGWQWWYGVLTTANGVLLVIAYFLLAETAFTRTTESANGVNEDSKGNPAPALTTADTIELDFETYGTRSFRQDLKLLHQKPKLSSILTFYKNILKVFCIPTVFWLFLLNGAYLGIYVFEASTFAGVLMSPPYRMTFTALGYVQAGQIVCCLLFLPLFGYGSDLVIKVMSKRNNGKYKQEYRLIPLLVPAVVGLVCTIIYGQSAAFPAKWGIGAPIFTYNASFFAFLGVNVIAITYAVDSYPLHAEEVLTVICSGRGIVSFGQSYSILPSIKGIGYDGATIAQAGIAAGLSVLGIAVYFGGPLLRRWAVKRLGID